MREKNAEIFEDALCINGKQRKNEVYILCLVGYDQLDVFGIYSEKEKLYEIYNNWRNEINDDKYMRKIKIFKVEVNEFIGASSGLSDIYYSELYKYEIKLDW